MDAHDLAGIELCADSETFDALDAYVWARINFEQFCDFVLSHAASDSAASTIAANINALEGGAKSRDDFEVGLMDLYKATARSEYSTG